MSRPEEIEGYGVPLHVALTQPILMGGAPRTFAILNGTVALVIGMGLHLWWLGFPAGATLHMTAVLMSKRDPHWFDIFRRHVRQRQRQDSIVAGFAIRREML
jgi:type IV secretion system protein VirB3